jgi:hypothetical protein
VDFINWLSELRLKNPVPRYPIVFFNTCNGGVTDEAFRTNFVAAFLTHGAVAMVSPIAEVDIEYADAFASMFFESMFAGMSPDRSLTDIAHQVRCSAPIGELLSGLLYGVFSLVQVRFHRALQRRVPAAAAAALLPADLTGGRRA